MYRYDEFDETLVRERAKQFRGQVERRLKGELREEHFKPLRLQNGVYLQLHAYMLRVAIPYGQLNAKKMRQLAYVADKFDKGYAHFTTRQNVQYNWIKLADMPDVLDVLADVEMHAIQTSGNCIRNVTSDHLAGANLDEIEDPRPWCEIIRQWSTFHPEFSSPAAQVQDRGDGGRDGSCGRARARYRPAHEEECRRPRRLRIHRRRRSWAHALYRPDDARVDREGRPAELSRSQHARLQPPWPPGQQVQGAHQDPGERAGS